MQTELVAHFKDGRQNKSRKVYKNGETYFIKYNNKNIVIEDYTVVVDGEKRTTLKTFYGNNFSIRNANGEKINSRDELMNY